MSHVLSLEKGDILYSGIHISPRRDRGLCRVSAFKKGVSEFDYSVIQRPSIFLQCLLSRFSLLFFASLGVLVLPRRTGGILEGYDGPLSFPYLKGFFWGDITFSELPPSDGRMAYEGFSSSLSLSISSSFPLLLPSPPSLSVVGSGG